MLLFVLLEFYLNPEWFERISLNSDIEFIISELGALKLIYPFINPSLFNEKFTLFNVNCLSGIFAIADVKFRSLLDLSH